ncbi:Hypp4901 [Branchiostoma lanceolatum]|uniref:Hypp4901 protein n=1 Tax=Branchiostoma lanceolatum TaxID=7740 RepID=A0A8K0EZT1_BRALA|nr:Hypp4901 [Branchiostoma lanceolatum]
MDCVSTIVIRWMTFDLDADPLVRHFVICVSLLSFSPSRHSSKQHPTQIEMSCCLLSKQRLVGGGEIVTQFPHFERDSLQGTDCLARQPVGFIDVVETPNTHPGKNKHQGKADTRTQKVKLGTRKAKIVAI